MDPDVWTTASRDSTSLRTTAVRALTFVAVMMLLHSVLMLDPADAHGVPAGPMSDSQAAMTMPTDSSGHPDSDVTASSQPDSDHHRVPQPDDRDCGVVLPAVMPGGPVAHPIATGCPLYLVPEAAQLPRAGVVVPAGLDRPGQDPRRKRSLLQIWRV